MKIGFIGCGNMGGALASAVASAAENESDILLFDKDLSKAEQLAKKISATVSSGEDIAAECDLVFLGVKPNVLEKALEPLKGIFSKRSNFALVSMAAGVKIEKLAELSETDSIIRIMPNTPVSVGAGVVLYTVTEKAERFESGFLSALENAGVCIKMQEELIDAGCAVSGCGPAFVYLFIESLADGGVNCGLSRKDAMQLAANTVMGAAEMVLQKNEHPAKLKDDVCSPGGSTIAGVTALEKGAFRGTVQECVLKAFEKTKQLG